MDPLLRRCLYVPWAFVASPAIAVAIAATTELPDSDAVYFGLMVALPSGLALAAGLIARAGYAWAVIGTMLAPVIAYVALAWVGDFSN